MFTGIIQATAPVLSSGLKGGCRRVRIQKPPRWKFDEGQSISVDGICSTVIKHVQESFEVEYMPETLSKTTAGSFAKGCVVNLEHSLMLKDLVGGHLVQGHVDARGRVVALVDIKRSRELIVAVPKALAKNVALHGSITINGVGLTVARKHGVTFIVALIPYTLAHTNLNRLQVGDHVNVETDHTADNLFAVFNWSKVSRDAKDRVRKGL